MNNNLYDNYISAPLRPEDKNEVETQKDKLLQAGAFAAEPVFGTGGMRAITGNGTNRLNRYNIVRLNLSLAAVLKQHKQNGENCHRL